MKSQLSDTSAISGSLELAPPTRKLMQWKETGGVDKLFSMTSRTLRNKTLCKLYTRNMVTKSLADITNSAKLDKTSNQTLKQAFLNTSNAMNNSIAASSTIINNDLSVEASMNNNEVSKNVLPLADSFIDNNNDLSKQAQLDELTLDANQIEPINTTTEVPVQKEKQIDLDEMEPMGEPSMFTSNGDMLLNEMPSNLEVTPGKEVKIAEEKKKESSESEEEEEEEEEAETDETKKTTKRTPKKRSYRKSLNVTVSKDVTIRDEPEDGDETLTNDPSKVLTKRAKTMVSILKKSFNKNDNVGFFELIKKNGRKNVVQKFYSLLVLSKYEIIEVSQEDQYDDIIISQGDKFETFA